MENKGNSLAKISIGINVILIIAVIILFVKMPSAANTETIADTDDSDSSVVIIPDDGTLRIGYFQSDSLNSNLLLMKELEGMMEQSQKNAENKMRSEEGKIKKWQEKWQKGGQLLPSEQERYQIEAQEMEQKFMATQQQVQMTLANEQEGFMFTLITRITNASKEYAETNGYDYIMAYSLGQNLYYGSPNFDITDDLIAKMNKDYEGTSSEVITDGSEEDSEESAE